MNNSTPYLSKAVKLGRAVGLAASCIILFACGKSETATVPEPAPPRAVAAPVVEKVSEAPIATSKATPPKVLSGARIYKKCQACHLKTGEGVTGAYPPLKGSLVTMLDTDEGREYLTLVAHFGVSGPIEVDGTTYSGIMPGQAGMSPEKVTAVLNHIMVEFNGVAEDDPRLFTSDFVSSVKEKHGRLSGKSVRVLRPQVYEQEQ